jgi:hypothetical protein
MIVPNVQIQLSGNINKTTSDIIVLDMHGSIGHNPKNNKTRQLKILRSIKHHLKTKTPTDVYKKLQKNSDINILPHYAGDPLLTIEWLEAAFESNSCEDLLEYLTLEHDFGVWKLVTATTKRLLIQDPEKKIVQIRVLQNRGVVDANRRTIEAGVRNTFDAKKHPDLHQKMAQYHLSVLETVEKILERLAPTGFLFIPHSMNKVSKYSSDDLTPDESPGHLRDYILNFTQPQGEERSDMYIDEDPDGNKLGSKIFYAELEHQFAAAKKTLVANKPYLAMPVSCGAKYLKKYAHSALVEIRKDHVAKMKHPDQSYASHLLTKIDSNKIEAYANMYVKALLLQQQQVQTESVVTTKVSLG